MALSTDRSFISSLPQDPCLALCRPCLKNFYMLFAGMALIPSTLLCLTFTALDNDDDYGPGPAEGNDMKVVLLMLILIFQVNQVDQVNQVNQMKQANQVNQVEQVKQANQVNHEKKQMCHVHQVKQVNQV